MQHILIVEDDVIIGGGVKTYLETKGYEVTCSYSMKEARDAMAKTYDLVILDINLPDGNGLNLCKMIRTTSGTPVIFLTAKDTEEDMIAGFQYGCDDYIPKPFSVEVLNQRIMAVLRRSNGQNKDNSNQFRYLDMLVDFDKMQVYMRGEAIKLSPTEYRLLELLIQYKGQVLTRNRILEVIWDCDGNYIDENTLNVHIRRLRKKLETDGKNPQYIITVFGIGYTFGD